MKLSMIILQQYLYACLYQRMLDPKTIKAYRIDLMQFINFENGSLEFNTDGIKRYIAFMNQKYKPRTVKRKIASLRALASWMEEESILSDNPFLRMRIRIKEPEELPRTIPLRVLEQMLGKAYLELRLDGENALVLRDVAIMEMLFATGIRVSELCSLKTQDIDLVDGIVRIYGKGAKERLIQLTNTEVITVLRQYMKKYRPDEKGKFFVNNQGTGISDQTVRRMLRKYTKKVGISTRITPHMFRHTLATLLLEEDVDIRYIQQLLGHSSILTTQIYTHVSGAKQRDILTNKHPRNRLAF